MNPTKALPENYKLRFMFSLKEDKRLAFWLQVAGVALFFLFGWIFVRAAQLLRPDFADPLSDWMRRSPGQQLLAVTGMLIVLFVVVTLHELIHGLCFWWFTREPPHYGIGPGYAFAAAPDWYIPRDAYYVIGLSPFIAITLIGLAAVSLSPLAAVPPLLFAVTANASGAVGDLWITYRIAREPGDIRVKDFGDGFYVYAAG